MDSTFRETVANHLKSAPGTAQRATALALLDAMTRQLAEEDGGRRQTLRLLREALAPSADEEGVLTSFLSRTQQRQEGEPAVAAPASPTARRRVRGQEGGTPLLNLLTAQLDGLGLDQESAQRLTEALAFLNGACIRTTDSAPPMGVITSGFTGDPTALLDAMQDEDLTVALQLALGGLPAAMWAVPALLAHALYQARTRAYVGHELQVLINIPSSDLS